MPRLPRIHVEGSIYYVSSKSTDNQRIFREKADYKMYLDQLAKNKSQKGFQLFSYCLLPDRLFLLMEPGPNSTISEIMHHLNSFYTKYYNSKNERRGPLFESRFKSVFVEKSAHLGELTRHIHRLPKQYEVPDADARTSRDAYLGNPPADAPEISKESEEVLRSLNLARDRWQAYEDAETPEIAESLEKRLGRGGMLGSEEFVEKVKGAVKTAAETREEARQAVSPARRMVTALALGAVVVTTLLSVYLYASREQLKHRYETVVQQMQESIPSAGPLEARAGEAKR